MPIAPGTCGRKEAHMTRNATRSTDISTGESTEIATGGLTPQELDAESITALPDKEVVSILDLNVDVDLALDLAAPIDLAVAANANVAAPIDAAVGANVLSAGSTAQALSDQGVMITQGIVGDSSATAHQVSGIDQSDDIVGTEPPVTGAEPPATGADTTVGGIDTGDALSGNILNVNVDVNADADLTAPIAGAVAANANVAAPIDAAAAANVGSLASSATAISQQDAIIDQSIDGDATAVSDQTSDITQ